MENMEKCKVFLSDDLYIQFFENKIGMVMKKNATKVKVLYSCYKDVEQTLMM